MKLRIQVVTALLCIVTISGMRVSFPPVGNPANDVDNQHEFLTSFRKSIRPDKVATNWITQKLDHFSDSNTKTWQMKYVTNDKHFMDGGAIFIFLGGAGTISSNSIKWGHFYDMAKEHHGYLVTPEHRYFGESIPTDDLSIPNLKYLSINQTLADVDHLIRTLKDDVPKLANAKVIMAGGSNANPYAGSLVVWFKHLYPELVDGSWASSAPLLAKANFHELSEAVGKAYRVLGSQQCYDRIERGLSNLDQMLAHSRSAEVVTLLNLCDDFDGNSDLDVGALFRAATTAFTWFVIHGNEETISEECISILNASDDLTAVVHLFFSYYDSSTCVNDASFRGSINQMANITDFSGKLRRQWAYIACNEVGWFQISSSENQPFGRNAAISLFVDTCAQLFGNQYTNSFIEEKILDTNELFGGRNPHNMQNVHMTYGELDPWRPIGVAQGATIIPRALVASDLSSIRRYDSPQEKSPKEEIARLVRKWLA